MITTETATATLALVGIAYLIVKMLLSVVIYVQAWRYTEVVTTDDPVVRAQIDAYSAGQERAHKNHLRDVAERAQGNAVNLDGERRRGAEKMGRDVGKFSADVVAKEIEARRRFKLGMFAAATSLVSKP